ncbi:hydroxymethylpyrimidine/phosphomethylpyrimidine kinase [Parapedobacter tibetensis]|uniref:hydroxymethylpyrimidine/phosphomethylpyrimidine kinase n=1 Tax=Parapedobacter tibetensis TaxID=2972951 RepID=UPI00214D9F80|nr:hydroxymethylpyrimidine/phosphomethylpyrimidine kinase [Parapedobacter tibetensis]
MDDNRPYVLSIAGFDPSGGAGLLADCKVFEQFECVGLAVCTAITIQTEDRFHKVRWLSMEEIKQQLAVLLERYAVKAIKIGIIEDLTMLAGLLAFVRECRPDVFVLWDPVVASSSGFELLNGFEAKPLATCLALVDMLTPNIPEAETLFGTAAVDELQEQGLRTMVYLKGGHAAVEERGVDYLIATDGKVIHIPPFGKVRYGKHGSGCILSASIAAGVALGLPIIPACQAAKRYTEQALDSNPTGLAYHKEEINGKKEAYR